MEHWNGSRWSVVSLPASVSSGLLLDGVTATRDGQVWVAGEAASPTGGGRPLIEHFVPGSGWHVQHLPTVPDGANWSNLYGVATGGGSVWAVGTYVDPVPAATSPVASPTSMASCGWRASTTTGAVASRSSSTAPAGANTVLP